MYFKAAQFATMLALGKVAWLLFLSWASLASTLESVTPVPQGFPSIWNGSDYKQAACEVIQKPPSWVDGLLFAQTSGSYGDQSNPKGQKILHLFDAISGVSVYDVSPKQSTFTGAYYPTKAYKIWDFNDRDMAKSKVAWWTMFSDMNQTAMKTWRPIQTDFGKWQCKAMRCRKYDVIVSGDTPPNVDFWKVGTSVIAGTESFDLGMTFDVPSIDNFRPFPFKDVDGIMKVQLVPFHIPMHEHVDPDTGLIWSAVIAVNVTASPPSYHQVVYTVDPQGVRKVEGIFNFSPVDVSKCAKDAKYSGPTSGNGVYMPRYMHTVTATTNYLILPMSSMNLRVCHLIVQPQFPPENATVFDPTPNFIFDWDQSTSVVFLLFDKKSKKFLEPIESKTPQFFTHQFNSYESAENEVITDLIAYDMPVYNGLTLEKLLKNGDHPELDNHVYRYTIDLKNRAVSSRSLLPPEDPVKIEFSQINHRFEGKSYKYGYAVQFPFLQPNHILKIDVDTPSGENNKKFEPGDSISLSEPYFVPKPGSKDEDDGVLVVRGLDTSVNKTRVYVIDAKTMTKTGEILSPYFTPFGLHERFYTREALGLKPSGGARGASISAGRGFFSLFGKKND